jgi:1-deoxy-D-xylulose-5-phosphate reductoisomerase
MKRVTIIGSTGSVGRSALDVIDFLDPRFEVVGLAAHSSVSELVEQTKRYRPRRVSLGDEEKAEQFEDACRRAGVTVGEIHIGAEGLSALASARDTDIVVSAAVGAAGLVPTYAALRAGKTVALANKEAMVIGGELLRRTAETCGATLIPVDSEHNAIDQCLRAGRPGEVRRLILTASGGPFFRNRARDLGSITPEEALDHPTWKMGRRITIDSATLMNKGLEVIEARWLFDIDATAIDIIVHPQSIVHSMVEFVDGSVVAQMGTADMRGPIQYALTFPDRVGGAVSRLDWTSVPALEFHEPDRTRFPAMDLAYRAIEIGGTAPAVLNAADEVAVEAFLARRIGFTDIPRIIASVLESHQPAAPASIDHILEADSWGRARASELAVGSGSTAV